MPRLRRAVALLLLLWLLPSSTQLVSGADSTHRSVPSAARPGHRLVGTLHWDSARAGIGGDVARRDLTRGEGAGKSWCADNGGYLLGASYKNIYACGPANGAADDFDTAGFQCVELSERFMWARYDKVVYNVPDGKDLVRLGGVQLGATIGAPGVGSLPAPGDVVSMWGGPTASIYGHTAVVTAVDVDSTGNGTIKIMEENGLQSGWDQIDVSQWKETYGDRQYDGGLYYYTHIQWLELASGSRPTESGLRYRVRSLPQGMLPKAINDLGQVTGVAIRHRRGGSRLSLPFLHRDGKTILLHPPIAKISKAVAVGINNNGVIAAWAGGGGQTRPYALRTRQGLSWRPLPLPAGHGLISRTTAIDAQGDMSGWVSSSSDRTSWSGAQWTHVPGGYVGRSLHATRGFRRPVVTGVDHWGDAVGTELYGTRTFAVAWSAGGQPFRLDGLSRISPWRSATAMVASGSELRRTLVIAGSSTDASGSLQACLWNVTVSRGGLELARPRPLGLPPGYVGSRAVGLNSEGWVVGDLARPGSAGRAFLWRPGIGMVNLDSLVPQSSGWVILKVFGLNSKGEIIGQGYKRTANGPSKTRGLLLQPLASGQAG